MARSRRSSSSSRPARPAPARNTPATRQSSVPANQAQQTAPAARQPGMFAQMASTAAGVAVGSTVGHVMGAGITSMFTGGSREPQQQQMEAAPMQQQQQQEFPGACDADQRAFIKCLDSSNSDMNACQFYLDMLKQCKSNVTTDLISFFSNARQNTYRDFGRRTSNDSNAQTGTVGQRFIQLLESHPQFIIAELAASPKSAGKPYSTATNWKLSYPCPSTIQQLILLPCTPSSFTKSRVIFSGLDGSVAGDIESAFQSAGFFVFSNAKNHRMNPIVPLCVPLCNTEHMSIIPHQQQTMGVTGFLVTNANCSTTALVVPLKALEVKFGPIDRACVTTMQAISGAGYPGVPSLDIFDNIVPHISGEEEKIELETCKILGSSSRTALSSSSIVVSATCNRVAVLDGHTECVSLSFTKRPPPSVAQVVKALREFRCEGQDLGVYSAPAHAIIVHDSPDRPQPRLDRDAGSGMSVSVGRVRNCPLFDIKFTLLAHNTILGAAGSSIMNAEVALARGYIYCRLPIESEDNVA